VADPVVSRVVLATRNAGKIAELSRILDAAGFADGIVGLDAFPGAPDVAETGLTFADNALLKARAIAAYTGLPAVADDSGLCVDALHGMPGVFSARWSGKHGDDRANLDLVLGQLADVAARGAQFVCVAALCLPGGSVASGGTAPPDPPMEGLPAPPSLPGPGAPTTRRTWRASGR
jgi:XTP/dITP diphosphohydrolase